MRLRVLSCALVLAALVAGCGGSTPEETETPDDALTIYSSLPLQGPGAERSRDIVDGEKLALAASGGRIGPLTISYRSLDDAGPEGGWKPDETVDAARAAAADVTTIAYLGDFEAGATALSLPTTNAAGVLQVSPGTSYDGFTGGRGAGTGEPEKYEPSGARTYARIPPPDAAQAAAMAAVLDEHGCRRAAVLTAESAFEVSLGELVADVLARRGVRVAHTEQVRADPELEAHADAAQAVVDAGARCVAFAGTIVDEPASLLEALRAADPALRFVLPMGLADAELARALAPVAEATTIVGPPPPSTGFAERFAEEFGRQPGPWAQYGHTAMRRVLEAIEAAGENGNDRTAVTESYLALPRPAEDLALWQPGPDGLRLERRLPAT